MFLHLTYYYGFLSKVHGKNLGQERRLIAVFLFLYKPLMRVQPIVSDAYFHLQRNF